MSLLILFITLSIAVPCGRYLETESFEIAFENSSKSDALVLALNGSKGSQESVTDLNVKNRKISVETIDSTTGENRKSIYRLSYGDKIVALNGVILSLAKNDKTVITSNTGTRFKPIKSNVVSEINFGEDFISPKSKPKIGHLRNQKINTASYATHTDVIVPKMSAESTTIKSESAHANSNSSASLREINYYVVLPEDYASDNSEINLVSEVVRITFNANQYLQDLGFKLVPIGIKIYRGTSRYTQALQNRDPYTMLSKGVEERNEIGEQANGNLLSVFSKTLFTQAAGLSYLSTACENPYYSVLFASAGVTKANYEIALSAVLAHEVGHYLGMSHDDVFYEKGFSLMAARQVTMPFGFSEKSKQEQTSYSAADKSGGECLIPSMPKEDSDDDGVADVQELALGTSPNDSGSYYIPLKGTSYLQWNTNLNQETVGEFWNVENKPIQLLLTFRSSTGKVLSTLTLPIAAKSQQDILFGSIIGNYKDSYGTVEITSNSPYIAKGTTYSFSKNFENFSYVSQQDAFQGVTDNSLFFPVNFNVPNTMAKGSRVAHWLSLINTGNSDSTFRVSFYSQFGAFRYERLYAVAAKSRLDAEISIADSLDASGSVKVEQLTSGNAYSFNAFLNRYYEDKSAKILSNVLIDSEMPSGVTKHLVHSNSLRLTKSGSMLADGWLEIHNALLVTNTVRLKAVTKNSEIILDKSFEIFPYGEVHVQLPSMTNDYILSIESDQREGIRVVGLKYINDKGVISNEQLKFLEENLVTKQVNINSFVSTSSQFVVTNSTVSKGLITCSTHIGETPIVNSIPLSSSRYEIIDVSTMFPTFPKNGYARVSCDVETLDKKPVLSSMRVDRFIEQNKLLQTTAR